ncbi:PREDICTED: lymphocyte antigen 6 complex locus protein G6d [Chrysochloris asiatica]|uniref:Lymphocyte antigen 6 complex locus protein G6d n=1 Tax=Chrysochloris asiatica TaxID=185453 RepID=A0A9B0WZD9_CHRAS|nr:PREDICTED: lymphocyte antigen 6 complex locus protein G6d [Chrysochloris asiatica]
MNPQLVGILLGTLLETALGTRMRCFDCRNPGSSCKGTVTTCGEGERCGFLDRRPHLESGQMKRSGNPSVTVIHHHPACVAAHHCNQVETELVGDVTYTTHRDCCFGDLCNSSVTIKAVPASILAVTATALAWLLPGLWRGQW